MNRNHIEQLLRIAATHGFDAAVVAMDDAEQSEQDRVALYGYEDDEYVPGCSHDDTVDYRGRPLLSRINEAGEPRW